MGRAMRVLGIESSCDDTGVAIVDQDGRVLSNCIHSQIKQHLDNGGIIPVLARDYHLKNIDQVAKRAVEESNLESIAKDVDAIAVSTRPGLKFSLQVGLNYARTLCKKYSKPLIPIHHMQAHALMPLLDNRSIRFPAIALLISGGHCILSVVKRYNEFHILGSTRDESPGDLLEKVARRFKLKNLGQPFDEISGGAALEMLSKRDGANRFKYFDSARAVPMMSQSNCDFSFTGYRGNVDLLAPIIDTLWASGKREELLTELSHISGSLQRVVLIQLVRKLHRAFLFYRMHWRYMNKDAFKRESTSEHLGFGLQEIDDETGALDILISGGVAANGYLVETIKKACHVIDPAIRVYAPAKELCPDNGVMVAWNGLLRYQDFMNNAGRCSQDSLENSVICDINQLDLVNIEAKSAMGPDISEQVRAQSFKIKQLELDELRVGK